MRFFQKKTNIVVSVCEKIKNMSPMQYRKAVRKNKSHYTAEEINRAFGSARFQLGV